MAVAGLCVLRRGCLALGASVKLGTAASPCTTCSGFTDCTRLWPNLSKELVPATNRASIQNTLHKPRAKLSQLQFLHGWKQPGHHYKINAPASLCLTVCVSRRGSIMGLFVFIPGGVSEWQDSRGADAMLSTLTNGLTERL